MKTKRRMVRVTLWVETDVPLRRLSARSLWQGTINVSRNHSAEKDRTMIVRQANASEIEYEDAEEADAPVVR